jgi:hypothetical protein
MKAFLLEAFDCLLRQYDIASTLAAGCETAVRKKVQAVTVL